MSLGGGPYWHRGRRLHYTLLCIWSGKTGETFSSGQRTLLLSAFQQSLMNIAHSKETHCKITFMTAVKRVYSLRWTTKRKLNYSCEWSTNIWSSPIGLGQSPLKRKDVIRFERYVTWRLLHYSTHSPCHDYGWKLITKLKTSQKILETLFESAKMQTRFSNQHKLGAIETEIPSKGTLFIILSYVTQVGK